MLILPFTSEPAYDVAFTLDEYGAYTFGVRYNERAGYWTFDLTRDSDGAKLLSGVPLLVGGDLLKPYGLGIGALVAADQNGLNQDAGPEDLGSRVIVGWLSPAEMAALNV